MIDKRQRETSEKDVLKQAQVLLRELFVGSNPGSEQETAKKPFSQKSHRKRSL